MKYAAILSAVVLLAVIAGGVWLFLSAELTVDGITVEAVEASAQPELFGKLKSQVGADAVIGTAFSTAPLGDAEGYQFLTYRVRLKNATWLSADMISIEVYPMADDILQVDDETAHALDAGSTGEIAVVILTKANAHPVREMNVTWSMWGRPFSIRTSYRGEIVGR